jgi:NAD(P)-dependent dehydrogenase (short-subunit alcohol dehydrogenase family)
MGSGRCGLRVNDLNQAGGRLQMKTASVVESMYHLSGKVALITGAGGEHGIGRAIATRLAREGADVIVNDIVTPPPDATGWGGLPEVVREIETLGRQSMGIVADVSDADQVYSMVRQAIERFGHIDILVNNAGAPAGRDRVPVVDLEEDAWDLVQNVNIKGTFLCCKAVARTMMDRGRGGKIINMSSTSGKRGVARFAAYCASKFAIIGFTQSLAHELGPYHINVNVICPNLIETERIDDMAAALKTEDMSAEEYRAKMIERVKLTAPLRRTGQATDVAKVAAFLASSESDYLTGQSINVSGGHLMS